MLSLGGIERLGRNVAVSGRILFRVEIARAAVPLWCIIVIVINFLAGFAGLFLVRPT